jgi:hypothetical protein
MTDAQVRPTIALELTEPVPGAARDPARRYCTLKIVGAVIWLRRIPNAEQFAGARDSPHARRPFAGPEQELSYRARYTHSVAISNPQTQDSRRLHDEFTAP